MKSRRLGMTGLLLMVGLLCTGCDRAVRPAAGTSFRAQLCELVKDRESGQITEREYRSSRQHILSVMLH